MTARPLQHRWHHFATATTLTIALLYLAAGIEAIWHHAGHDRVVTITTTALVFKPHNTQQAQLDRKALELELSELRQQQSEGGLDWDSAEWGRRPSNRDTLFYTALQASIRYGRHICILLSACPRPPSYERKGAFDGYELVGVTIHSEGFENWLWPKETHWAETSGGCGCATTDEAGNAIVCYSCLLESSLFSLQYLIALALILWLLINGSVSHGYRHSRAWWHTRHDYKDDGAGSRLLWIAQLILRPDEIKLTLFESAKDARRDLLDGRDSAPTIFSRMYASMLTTTLLLIARRLLQPLLRRLR